MTIVFSDTQKRRLRELGAAAAALEAVFESHESRDLKYQNIERELVKHERQRLQEFAQNARRSRVCKLERNLSDLLVSEGFIQVTSPIIMSRSSLAKMGLEKEHPLYSQVFWLDDKKCLRPMLAPHLYAVAGDLLRLNEGRVSLFEIGPCFRKESQGAKHSNEFTMLNLAEFGLPESERQNRLEELAAMVIRCAGELDVALEVEESEVYGDTLDIVDRPTGMELGSSAMGPHPLDYNWRINSTWVGIGFGLERLVMATDKGATMGSLARSLSYLDGIRLNI